MNCIEVKNLTKRFRDMTAVDNLSFEVKEGEIFGLLGSNGAGKTTTLNILTGLLLPTEGDVKILGLDVRKDIEKIRKDIAIVPQEISLYEELSIYENLKFFGKIYNKYDDLNSKIYELLNLFKMEDKKDKLVCYLSGGYQRRASIACALLAEPKILFLDEPTAGIDLITNQIIMDYIKEQGGKITIIITTHSVKEAEAVCDTILFMHEGKMRLCGKPSSLITKYASSFGQRVTVQFQGELSKEGIQKIVGKYKKEIKHYAFDEGYFIFDTNDIGAMTLKIIDAIENQGVEIINIDIRKPSLEDVFKYAINEK
jgi:ABC-2 type transport system ATP-binding protein